ncbi:MAG: hypothetical protein IT159_15360 [Bryobacterales bacterium]|nr:hypothetical protein [Bryobacterales bacterium]
MTARVLWILLAAAVWCRAEIIDRVAATVGTRAITLSDVWEEIRVSALLSRTEPDFGPASRKAAAARLVERALIEIEMEIGRYPAPREAEVNEELETIRKQYLQSTGGWTKALESYQVREEDVRRYLLRQLAVARFIDARFGPGVQVLEEEVQAYYQGRFAEEWAGRTKQPLPPLEEVHAGIEEILRSRRVDALLDQWLDEARARARIHYQPEAFQ